MSLRNAKAIASATTNTRYGNLGEVTVSMPVEMAQFLLGRVAKCGSTRLKGKGAPSDCFDVYDAFFGPVEDAIRQAGFEYRDDWYKLGEAVGT